MRKVYIFILSLLPIIAVAQPTVLQQFFDKLEKNTLQGNYSFTMQDNASQPLTYKGNIVMRGEKFVIQMAGIKVSWDGKILYSYSEDTNELTLSEPSKQELTEANPLLYAKALAANCQITENEKNEQWQIILIPQNKDAGVKNFTLYLRKSDLMPLRAEMKETATKKTTLSLLESSFTDFLPSFVIEEEGAYINDLR
ncbi:MAG: outer membrane lipoprotein carrier protein LolA [Paludibacteraceae bacterium]|nr:outer membrane lipoprotein carrier protein LolA [Paludibacteraceae bacterium]